MWLNKKLKKNDENDQILKRLGKKIKGKNTSPASWKEYIKKWGDFCTVLYIYLFIYFCYTTVLLGTADLVIVWIAVNRCKSWWPLDSGDAICPRQHICTVLYFILQHCTSWPSFLSGETLLHFPSADSQYILMGEYCFYRGREELM